MRSAEFGIFYDIINRGTGILIVFGFDYLYNSQYEDSSSRTLGNWRLEPCGFGMGRCCRGAAREIERLRIDKRPDNGFAGGSIIKGKIRDHS